MGWFYLALAIVFEVMGTTSMKLSEGFSRLWPSVLLFVFYGLSFTSLTFALKKIDLSVAYAVWSGVGTALIVVIGVWLFRESLSAVKLAGIALVILGVVLLNLTAPAK